MDGTELIFVGALFVTWCNKCLTFNKLYGRVKDERLFLCGLIKVAFVGWLWGMFNKFYDFKDLIFSGSSFSKILYWIVWFNDIA